MCGRECAGLTVGGAKVVLDPANAEKLVQMHWDCVRSGPDDKRFTAYLHSLGVKAPEKDELQWLASEECWFSDAELASEGLVPGGIESSPGREMQ